MKAASATSCSRRKSPSNGKLEFRLPTKAPPFDEGFRADILVDRQVIIEIKAVANLLPAHDAQVLTYLRMSGLRLGLLFNFPCVTVAGRPTANCRLKPLRAAPWFFVVSMLNACNRTDHTALNRI